MSLRVLSAAEPEGRAFVEHWLRRGATDLARVEPAVREILEAVRARGDDAVLALRARFEAAGRQPRPIEIDPARWRERAAACDEGAARALEVAATRVRAFHERVRARNEDLVYEEAGVRLGQVVTPMARAGLYAPGGKARYPSTVLMTAIPAAVAGVGEVVLCSPDPPAEVLRAALVAGVHRVFDIGGAQAIGAMAYGTATVPAVDVIVGPGNLYVACAKKLVSGDVAIDGIAGPSEAVILADGDADPALVAADLITQAEHDEDAYAMLVTPSAALAGAVAKEVDEQLATLPRRAIASRALADHGGAVVTADLDAAVALASSLAAEHLTIVTGNDDAILERRPVAGCIFVGPHTPQTAGDYVAGPSHVLPTGGAARFGAPLGIHHFLRRTSLVQYSREALQAQSDTMTTLARLEGLEGHARAVERR